jgi:hypothetical protein
MYNAPRLNAVRPSGDFTYAANAPILRISYSKTGQPGEVMTSQKYGATIAISENGGSGSKLLITLTELVKDVTGGAASNIVHEINGATYTTLKAVVDKINSISGFTAWVTDAPHSHNTNSDAFLALATTAVPEVPGYLDCLKRSVATTNPVYKRIGEPTERDSGWLKLIRAEVAITANAGGSIEFGRDDINEGYVKYRNYALSATANTAYANYDVDAAPTFQGPLLITIAATNATGAVGRVETVQATY